MIKESKDIVIDVDILIEEFALRCKECGRPLSLKTILPYIRRSHSGICKSCCMLGNKNAKKNQEQ